MRSRYKAVGARRKGVRVGAVPAGKPSGKGCETRTGKGWGVSSGVSGQHEAGGPAFC